MGCVAAQVAMAEPLGVLSQAVRPRRELTDVGRVGAAGPVGDRSGAELAIEGDESAFPGGAERIGAVELRGHGARFCECRRGVPGRVELARAASAGGPTRPLWTWDLSGSVDGPGGAYWM